MNINKFQRRSLGNFLKQQISDNKSVEQNLESIDQMVKLLGQFELQCKEKEDFQGAEEAKAKINFLKAQELLIKQDKLQVQEKQNMEIITELGDRQAKQFQEKWQSHFDELMETLKETELKLINQQEVSLKQFQRKCMAQQIPRIKYSPQVLAMRNNLQNLIKMRNYPEAEFVKNNLQKKEKEELQKWRQVHQSKRNGKIINFKRKQEAEVKVLRIKLEAIFNEQINRRNNEFQMLLKKNRKRMIQTSKMSRERLKSKNALLNQSRSFSMISKF